MPSSGIGERFPERSGPWAPTILTTLATVHNMASVFDSQGKYDDALEWYRRALSGQEQALGSDHPSTLTTVHNMASVFDSQGKYDDALEWYRRALSGEERALGPDYL
jgi:Tfp pilus assembly protein PilF